MGITVLLADAQSPPDLSIFSPASPPAASIRSLFFLVLAVTGVIFILVEGVLLYSIFHFRRRTPETAEPPQVYGSMPIEIAWTATPALIVFLLALILTRTEYEVRATPPKPRPGDNTLFVRVIGHQWWWEYVYEKYDGQDLGFITANELHMPASDEDVPRPIYLTLQSADVCHSFWVPRLAGKTDLIPGRTNQMWFRTSQPGLYLGQCAEYCGTQHAHMLLRVYADPREEFARWLEHQSKDAPALPETAVHPDTLVSISALALSYTALGRPDALPLRERTLALMKAKLEVRAGMEVFLSQSCINCHRIRGTSARGTYAPDLTHLMSRQTLASGMLPNTPENVAKENLDKWLDDPQKVKPGCLMPAFGLNSRDRDLLLRYLLTLR
jgi:cytochrome c oxidase subunit 2